MTRWTTGLKANQRLHFKFLAFKYKQMPSKGTEKVEGYTTKNGTKVKAYYRKTASGNNGKMSKTAMERKKYLKGMKNRSKTAMKHLNQKMPKCKPGNTVRNATVVKGYTRANGTRVKKSYRKASCIKDLGKPGEAGKGDILVKQGLLKRYGYHDVKNMNVSKRRAALREAAKKEGFREVISQLVAVSNLSKRSHPSIAKIFKADQEYISGLYKEYKEKHGSQPMKGGKKRKTKSKKKSKKKGSKKKGSKKRKTKRKSRK